MKELNVKKIAVLFLVFLTLLWVSGCFSWINGKISDTNLWKSSQKLDMGDFWEVYDIIEKEYFTSWSISKDDLVRGAIAWMVEALWDQHSEFMDPEITKKFNEALEWDFEGIGAVVEKVPLWVKIERILKWSPAKIYDVRSGDIVIKADEFELQDLDLYDAVDKIKGPAGTKVILTILRVGENWILEIEVTRDKIHIPSVEQEIFEEENIGYISLNMFGETTSLEFTKAIDSLNESDVSGIIVDVRDNGGWYLQSAVEILSEFIPKGDVLVKTKYKNDFFNNNYFSLNDGEIFDKKIVVLINGNSASASEITAGALREYDKAILVGQESYGKWSVQQPFEMEDGSLLKLTVAKWFTPEGINIEEEGVSPDIEIEYLEEDYETLYDRQLEEAKKILKLFIENETIGLSVEAYKKEAEKNESVNTKEAE